MLTMTDVLKSLVLEANPKLPSERVEQLVEKYRYTVEHYTGFVLRVRDGA